MNQLVDDVTKSVRSAYGGSVDDIFPIHNSSACQFKWSWSTIFLSHGTTTSCHRCKHLTFNKDTIKNFHNLPAKIDDREKMLNGEWNDNGCSYCKRVEDAGGKSERTAWINGRDLVPPEFTDTEYPTSVTPRLLEVYFTNLCNQACTYCSPQFSSVIEADVKKNGPIHGAVDYTLRPIHPDYDIYLEKFWEWMEENGQHLYEFQILGGEPMYQPEFVQCLDFFEKNPNPKLTFRIFSNLKHTQKKFTALIKRVRKLQDDGKIKKFQIIASMDCWGPQAEYARYGMNLKNWETNLRTALEHKIEVNIHMTISPLTLPTMAEFMKKIYQFRKEYNDIGWTSGETGLFMSSNTINNPKMFDPYVFGNKLAPYVQDAIDELSDPADKEQRECLQGMVDALTNNNRVQLQHIKTFRVFLDAIDERRGKGKVLKRLADWRILYPEINVMVEEILRDIIA